MYAGTKFRKPNSIRPTFYWNRKLITKNPIAIRALANWFLTHE